MQDRKSSAVWAVHNAPVESLYTPYIVPSENGNRCQVARLSFSNSVIENASTRLRPSQSIPFSPPKQDISRKSFSNHSVNASSFGSLSLNRSEDSHSSDCPVSEDPSSEKRDNLMNSNLFLKKVDWDVDDTSTDGQCPAFFSEVVGFRIASKEPFNFSAQRFITEDLSTATHHTDLEYFPRPFLAVNIDPFLMGVGGDDSWSASVHEDFLIAPDNYDFEFVFTFDLQ